MFDQEIYRITESINDFVVLCSDKEFAFRFINAKSFDPGTLLIILTSLTILVVAIIFLSYRYQRWKRYNEFVEEMKTLQLDPNSEGTLAFMVKSQAMDEPVKVLMSAQKFDDMAQKEMVRVLGSEGSIESKEAFINSVYKIRNTTYRPAYRFDENDEY